MRKPSLCKIGLHSYEAVKQHSPYVIEMRCGRCGKGKMVTLRSSRE